MDIAYECIFTLIVSSDGPGRQGIFLLTTNYLFDERRATVFFINNAMARDYTVFQCYCTIFHSMATRSFARWPTDGTVPLPTLCTRLEMSD
jgi:hypothetical protein